MEKLNTIELLEHLKTFLLLSEQDRQEFNYTIDTLICMEGEE